MRDIGDGDEEFVPIPIRLGIHRVVEVACISAVDGNQGDVAQIGAAAERGGAGGVGVRDGGGGKLGRDVVGVDANQGDRSRIPHRAEALDDAGRFQPVTGMRQGGGKDDFAIFRAVFFLARDHPFGLCTAVRGDHAGGRCSGAKHADDAARRVRQTLDGAAFVFTAADRF